MREGKLAHLQIVLANQLIEMILSILNIFVRFRVELELEFARCFEVSLDFLRTEVDTVCSEGG